MEYRIESTWVMTGVQFIEADTAEEAESKAINGALPMPTTSEYLSESFEVTDVQVHDHNSRMSALKTCAPPTAEQLKELTEEFNTWRKAT